jgi:YNFM family putative membrane transporter
MSNPSPAPAYRRTNRALFFGGFSCFALLYCVQPLMPLLAHEFALTPAQSSLSLSISTAALALSLLFSSLISDRWGRKTIMVVALMVSGLMTVLSAFAQNYVQLLVVRTLLGLALGGMPAVAMAYLSEEIDAESLGVSMGLYISGNAFGGMIGRMLASLLSDFLSWRVALGVMGVAGLLAAWEFWRSLPVSRNFRRSSGGMAALLHGLRLHFGDGGLPWLFALAFLLMGCFVSAYNFIGFRLLGASFGLRQSIVGTISLLYLLGIFSSVWAGRRADRLGRRHVLWTTMAAMLAGLLLTLSNNLVLIVAGMALYTFSFFASHSIASSWIGRRARTQQALASALYLFFYYLGSSLVGWLCGLVWAAGGWAGVVALLAACLGAGLLIALRLRGLAPVGAAPKPA